MNLGRNYRYLFLIILGLLVLLYAIFNFQPMSTDHKMSSYKASLIRFNQTLFELGDQCRKGQIDVAQNTYLDLLKDWQLLDVKVKTEANPLKKYYPSDSIQNLGILVDKIGQSQDKPAAVMLVTLEIKKINEKIDQMK